MEGRKQSVTTMGLDRTQSSCFQPSQSLAQHLFPELLLKTLPQGAGGAPGGQAILGSLPGLGRKRPGPGHQGRYVAREFQSNLCLGLPGSLSSLSPILSLGLSVPLCAVGR